MRSKKRETEKTLGSISQTADWQNRASTNFKSFGTLKKTLFRAHFSIQTFGETVLQNVMLTKTLRVRINGESQLLPCTLELLEYLTR